MFNIVFRYVGLEAVYHGHSLSAFSHFSPSGKSGTRAKRGLRDGDDVREPVRRGNQGPVGGRRYTGVLRSQTGIPAHGLSQVVSISVALALSFSWGRRAFPRLLRVLSPTEKCDYFSFLSPPLTLAWSLSRKIHIIADRG